MTSRSTFEKEHIDGLFGELNTDYKGMPESEQLHRDAHLAIAYHDSGRLIPDSIDPRVIALLISPLRGLRSGAQTRVIYISM